MEAGITVEAGVTAVVMAINKNLRGSPSQIFYIRIKRMTQKNLLYLWIARFLIGLVTFWNLQAAFAFIFSPGGFVSAYELSGIPGEAAIRGVGVLFLMWNVPYLFALVDPVRYRLALTLSLLMQLTGLIGETYIYFTIPMGHEALRSSIFRFIIFDGAGLILLVIAWIIGRVAKISA